LYYKIVYFVYFLLNIVIFHFSQKQDILFFQRLGYGGEAPEKDLFKEPFGVFCFIFHFLFFTKTRYTILSKTGLRGRSPRKGCFKEPFGVFCFIFYIFHFLFFIFHKNKIYYSFKDWVTGAKPPKRTLLNTNV